jgi:hypothetical protein
MGRVRQLVLVSAVAALLGGSFAPALATEQLGEARGVRYVRNTATLPGTSTAAARAEVRARCPKGWKAISGGVTIKAGAGRGIGTTSLGGNRYWYSDAWQDTATDTKLRGYSVCLQSPGLSTETKSVFSIPAGPHSVDQVVNCQSGHAVGGGIRSIGSTIDFSLNASYPVDNGVDANQAPDDGWHVYTQYTGHGGDGILVDVMCLEGRRPTYESTLATVPPSTTVKAKAGCPAGTRVLGGGVYTTGATQSSHVVATRPFDSGDRNKVWEDGWFGAVTNTSGGDIQMTVHAICR